MTTYYAIGTSKKGTPAESAGKTVKLAIQRYVAIHERRPIYVLTSKEATIATERVVNTMEKLSKK